MMTSACAASLRTSALSLGRFEIGFDAALAAIAAIEIGRAEWLAVHALDQGRTPMARIVARALALHLHDVCAEIGEQLPAPRPGENAREFENADAGEGSGHDVLIRKCSR